LYTYVVGDGGGVKAKTKKISSRFTAAVALYKKTHVVAAMNQSCRLQEPFSEKFNLIFRWNEANDDAALF